MRQSQVYGLPKGGTDAVADQLGAALGFAVERRSSSYLGNYCMCYGPDGATVKVQRNREPRGDGPRSAVDPPLYSQWAAYKVLVFADLAAGDLARLQAAVTAGFPAAVLLQASDAEPIAQADPRPGPCA